MKPSVRAARAGSVCPGRENALSGKVDMQPLLGSLSEARVFHESALQSRTYSTSLVRNASQPASLRSNVILRPSMSSRRLPLLRSFHFSVLDSTMLHGLASRPAPIPSLVAIIHTHCSIWKHQPSIWDHQRPWIPRRVEADAGKITNSGTHDVDMSGSHAPNE